MTEAQKTEKREALLKGIKEREAAGQRKEGTSLMRELGVSPEREVEIGVEVNSRMNEKFMAFARSEGDNVTFCSSDAIASLKGIAQTPEEGLVAGILCDQILNDFVRKIEDPMFKLIQKLKGRG